MQKIRKKKVLNFKNLVSHFGNRLALADRRELYEALKKRKLLRKVFGSNQQAVLRVYLFHEAKPGVSWAEYRPIESSDNDEVEEARVNFFFDMLMKRRPVPEHLYPRVRDQLMRQLYAGFQELNLRVKLMRRKNGKSDLSLAFVPMTLLMLERLADTFPGASTLEDLRDVTKVELRKKAQLKNPGLDLLLGLIGEKVPKRPELVLTAPPEILKRKKRQPSQPKRVPAGSHPTFPAF